MSRPTIRRRAYVETYGCQMNISDGELMEGVLEGHGYDIVDAPEAADVILVNTCAIREHAETRVLGRVGQLNAVKRERPGVLLGVTGCMAQRMGRTLLEKAPPRRSRHGARRLPRAGREAGRGAQCRARALRIGTAGGARPVPGRELPRPGAAPTLEGDGVGARSARVQPPLHLLHRALRARIGEEPRPPRGARRGAAGGPTPASPRSPFSDRR